MACDVPEYVQAADDEKRKERTRSSLSCPTNDLTAAKAKEPRLKRSKKKVACWISACDMMKRLFAFAATAVIVGVSGTPE